MNTKKLIKIASSLGACLMVMTALSGCSGSKADSTGGTAAAAAKGDFNPAKAVGVITREDGSGTRGAFISLLKLEKKEGGKTIDLITEAAVTTNNTNVMLTTVAGDLYSIGYSSAGSLNKSVKAIKVDNEEPSIENIKSKKYKLARPFNLVLTKNLTDNAKDFINFIMSKEGQAVIEKSGYVSVEDNAKSYTPSGLKGKITVAGSSSVTPVMEKLKEAYIKLNPDIQVEVQQSDSTTGVMNAVDGICNIGMASRNLKDSETAKGVESKTIAMDGIGVIVNPGNPITNLTSEQVAKIFKGDVAHWSDVMGDKK